MIVSPLLFAYILNLHREQKLELERRKALERELADCSFAPKVRVNPNIQVTSSVSGIINGQSTTTTASGHPKSIIAPTNTTFGSNIASASGNTQSYRSGESTANVRRGGAGTAKVAYNANKARQSQWADEGPFYVSEEAPHVSNTSQSKNKYYNASNPYANDQSDGHHSDNAYPDSYPQEQEQEYYSDGDYDEVPPAPPSPLAPPQEPARIRVPLPVKSTAAANNTAVALNHPQHQASAQQKSVHFGGPVENTFSHLNTHHHNGSNTAYSDDYPAEDFQESGYNGYNDEGPHEVTVDYGHSPSSDRSTEYQHHHQHRQDVQVHEEEDNYNNYNGLPFQVSTTQPHMRGDRSSEGSPYSPGSPAAGQAFGNTHNYGPSPHRLFPATPHQQAQANTRHNAKFGSFVEPAEEVDYDTLPSPRGGLVSSTHAPQQVHQASHAQNMQHSNTSALASRRMYQDEAERDSPPPPPPVVFRDSHNSTSRPVLRPAGAPPRRGAVPIPGKVTTASAADTPYAMRKGIESQLLSPDDD